MPSPLRRLIATGPGVLALLGIGALFVFFGLRAFHERNMAVDDAYILTRYASHFADGHGFRWNVTSAPVEGFTSPLFVVLLAGLLRLGIEPTLAAALLSIGAIGGVVVLLIAAAGPRRPGFAIAALPAAFLLLDPGIGVHASRGLETSVFFLVAVGLVAAAGSLVRQPTRRAGWGLAVVSFLLVLARPDGALIVAVSWVATAVALRLRFGTVAVLLPGAASLLAAGALLVGWKLWYFGALLPTAYYVKATGVGWAGVSDVAAFAADYRGWLIGGAAAALGTGAITFGRVSSRRRDLCVEAFIPAAITLPWLVYSAGILHETGFSHRFSFVLVPLTAFALTHGLRVVLDFFVEQGYSRPNTTAVVGSFVTVGFALMCIGPLSRTRDVLRSAPPSEPSVVVFTRLGHAIAHAGLGEQISFLSSAAGAAPYFAGARHIDSFGLATREFSKIVSLERRTEIIAESAFDVVEMPFLPAGPGAESAAGEPLRGTDYWRDLEDMGRNYQRYDQVDMEEWIRTTHWMMRYLRDNMTLVGAARYQGGRMNIYVSRASPHYAHLVSTLSRELDIPAGEVR